MPTDTSWIGRQGPDVHQWDYRRPSPHVRRRRGTHRLHWHQLRHTFAHTVARRRWQRGRPHVPCRLGRRRSMLDRYAKSAQVERAHAAGRRMSLGDRV